MPVIIPPEAFAMWLDSERVDALTAAALIAPAPDHLLEAYEVSLAVNRTANDSPALIEPLAASAAAGGAGGTVPPRGKNPRFAKPGAADADAPRTEAPEADLQEPKPKKGSGQAELF
jgi:hypothetical protein